MTELEDQIAECEQRLGELISEHGVVVQNVTGSVNQFSYTSGRNNFHVSKVRLKDYANLVPDIANRYRKEDHDRVELYLIEAGNESNNFLKKRKK